MNFKKIDFLSIYVEGNEINVLKGKQLTNVRASGSDEAVTLVTPKVMSLEEMMTYINSDELLEVTPVNLRLRKKYLEPNERKKHSKKHLQC